MDKLPNDPVILLSYINTMLRDTGKTLDEFCDDTGADGSLICEKLSQIDYFYDDSQRRFV